MNHRDGESVEWTECATVNRAEPNVRHSLVPWYYRELYSLRAHKSIQIANSFKNRCDLLDLVLVSRFITLQSGYSTRSVFVGSWKVFEAENEWHKYLDLERMHILAMQCLQSTKTATDFDQSNQNLQEKTIAIALCANAIASNVCFVLDLLPKWKREKSHRMQIEHGKMLDSIKKKRRNEEKKRVTTLLCLFAWKRLFDVQQVPHTSSTLRARC